jgi:hypothetical protein
VLFATADHLGGSITRNRILRAGSRKHEVWNPSPNVSNTPKAVRYSFTVDNSDGYFYDNTTTNVFKPSTYQADPQECIITHRIYIGIRGNSGLWTWSEVSHMAFQGQITDVDYTDGSDPEGDATPVSATITCEQVGAWAALRRNWTVDDATDHPMTQTNSATPFDFTWTVP